jgi:pentose-5-phosphate-3-epimerase
LDTVADVVSAGAEVLVAGSAIFGQGDIRQNVERLLQKARQATMQRV